MVEGSRRMGRLLAMFAAAAVVLGLVVVAVVGVRPGAVVSASGALLPESPPVEAKEPPSTPTPSPAPEVQRAVHRSPAELSPATAAEPAPVARALEAEAVVAAEPAPEPAPPAAPASAAEPKSAATPHAREKERAVVPAPKQKAPRRAVAASPRRRAAPPPKAAAKVDCRQPFWIDEAGIRRIKMACL